MSDAPRRRPSGDRRTRRDPRPHRRRSPATRPGLEGLEGRALLALITWNTTVAPAGGDFGTPANWNGGVAPTAADDAVIALTQPGTVTASGPNLAVRSLTTSNPSTTFRVAGGTFSVGTGNTSLGGPTTVAAGATLAVPANSGFLIRDNQVLTVNGLLDVDAARTFEVEDFNGGQFSGIVVNGTMDVTGTALTRASAGFNGSDWARIVVNPSGRLIASGSTFDWDEIYLDNGSVLNSGDLSGNGFDLQVTAPAGHLARLGSNRRFEDVNVLAGTLASGQTLNLAAIGTETSANLRYVFPGAFEVRAGATMTVQPGVRVLIRDNQVLTVNGLLDVDAAGSFEIEDFNGGQFSGIVVNGTMDVTGTAFTRASAGFNGSDWARIVVNPSGRLIASNATFDWDELYLDNGSILNAGDLVGNAFDLQLAVPAGHVARLGSNRRFEDINVLAGTLASGQTLNLAAIGTETTANLRYVFPGAFEVRAGATMTVQPGVRVLIRDNQVLTVNGLLDVDAAGSFEVEDFNGGQISGIVVGGTMDVAGTAFTRASGGFNGSDWARIVVNPSGRLIASGSTFDWDELYLDNGSVLNAGDLTGNAFDLQLAVPAGHVSRLAANRRFEDVNVLAGSLASGQTLNLAAIGTETTANLRYVFPGAFTVQAGATMTVQPGVRVLIRDNQVLTVNGLLDVDAAGSFEIEDFNGGQISGIVVNGTMDVTGTAFTRASGGFNGSDWARIVVNSSGRLIASGSTFDWDELYLDNGSVLNAGDLTGNAFDLQLAVPAGHVARLGSNRRFEDVNVLAGTLASGQTLNLAAIGTETTANLRYVFPGAFDVRAGATMTVQPGVRVLIRDNQVLTVNGLLDVDAAGSFEIEDFNGGQISGIVVNGTMDVTGTAFTRASGGFNGSDWARIVVNPSGRLIASGSTFDWDQLYLDPNSVLNAGDLTGNAFDLELAVPAVHVARLGSNRRFEDVNVLAGSLDAGRSLNLAPIGTETTANLRYVFPGAFEVRAGATVAVQPGVRVLLRDNALLTVSGLLDVDAAGSFEVEDFNGGQFSGIVVNGTMDVTGTALTRASGGFAGSDWARVVVNAGGRLAVVGGSFAWDGLEAVAGSNVQVASVILATQLSLSSGAAVDIVGNDLGNATVVALGDPAATIDLRRNFWGTTNAAQIEAKITHRPDAPINTRPLVLFDPPLNASPSAIVGSVFADADSDGVRGAGDPGQGGVTVYLDANNNGVLDVGERSAVTSADIPATPGVDEAGQYRFDGLAPGSYVARALVPAGFVQTAPSPAAVETTILFDGTGAESGVTLPGTADFTFRGARFSGGSVASPAQVNLRASGAYVYNASGGNAAVDFGRPVDLVQFFYVHGSGFAPGTATAYGVDGTELGSVSSRAATTSGDPANFVGLNPAQPIARIVFSNGIVDSFRFATQANDPAVYLRIGSGETRSGVDFGVRSVPGTLVAEGVSLTPTGFVATFAGPLDPAVLNLYDANNALGAADVTLVGQASGPVQGSLVLSPDRRTVTFVKTSGVLAPDAYTLTMRSGTNGVRSATGQLLDGNRDGIAGDDLVQVLRVDAASTAGVVVGVANAVRGPGQPVQIPHGAAGLPITLSSGTGVFGVALTLRYDPSMLAVTGVTLGAGLPTDWEVVSNTSVPGVVRVTVDGLTALGAGPLTLLNLVATVPTGAAYANKGVLDITDLAVTDATGASRAAVADDGVHVVGYPGDLNADGGVGSGDVSLLRRVIVGNDSGFAAFQMVDPVLAGDVNVQDGINAGDVSLMRRFIIDLPQSAIPPIPGGLTFTPSGLDPRLFIPTDLAGNPGDVLTVPVRMLVTEVGGIRVGSMDLAVQFDPARFTVGNLRLGGMLADAAYNFNLLARVDPVAGTIQANIVELQGEEKPFAFDTLGSVLLADFTVKSGAADGASSVNLRQSIGNTTTAIFDALANRLVLIPAPTNAPDDPVDGRITIGQALAATTTTAQAAEVTFSASAQSVALAAAVASPGTTVNAGTVTFTLLDGTTPVGSPVTVDVANGLAGATYTLPAGLSGGTYRIQAAYSGSAAFAASADSTRTLLVRAAASASATASASVVFGSASVPLTATITSPAGVVQGGTVVFTLLNGTVVLGTATATASAGAAATALALPAGLGGGTYTIRTEYLGNANFAASAGPPQVLTVTAAATATASANASVVFGATSVPLTATITSPAGVVQGGTVVFTLLNGAVVLGTASATASAGAAATAFALPAGLAGGTYTIDVSYLGTANFAASTGTPQVLTITAAATATASASASVVYGSASVPLTATITSPAGVVQGGTVVFTLLNGTVVLGTASATASAGAAATAFALPAGLAGGTYTIRTEYLGNANFAASTGVPQQLTISAAATATATASATAVFGAASVPLTATITSPAGVVQGGTVVFTLLNGAVVLGTASATASAGAAATAFALPSGLAGGTYTIDVSYLGTPNFAASTGTPQPLTITAAATATASANASVVFGSASVPLTATITSPAGVVQGGTVVFTLLNGAVVLGTASATASAGAAATALALPAGLAGGTYTIRAEYLGTPNFAASTGTPQQLTVTAAATATATANASVVFGATSVPLTATITSPAGVVQGGTVVFTLLNGAVVLGTASATASAGAAGTAFPLPAGLGGGAYTIRAEYLGTPSFAGSMGTAGVLNVTAAATATATANASVSYQAASQVVTLNATVTGAAGPVNGGTVTFSILQGATVIGVATSGPVAGGAASGVCTLPAGTPVGTYTIRAEYAGTPDFAPSVGDNGVLTVAAPQVLVEGVAAGWGSQSVALTTAADGIRLLPPGRSTSLPWFGINRLTLTLSAATAVRPGDIQVVGDSGGDYGPVQVQATGPNTVVVTLARGIVLADRVRLTVQSDAIVPYRRRLDVLPGDANDNGVVNTADGVLLLRSTTPANPYQIALDMDGDGAVTGADFNLYRPRIGTSLPAPPAMLRAAGGADGGGPVVGSASLPAAPAGGGPVVVPPAGGSRVAAPEAKPPVATSPPTSTPTPSGAAGRTPVVVPGRSVPVATPADRFGRRIGQGGSRPLPARAPQGQEGRRATPPSTPLAPRRPIGALASWLRSKLPTRAAGNPKP
jgi:hypothetical protein